MTFTIACRCPVCRAEFDVDPADLPHDYPKDPTGRMMVPCDARHPLVELWQAWRAWYKLPRIRKPLGIK